MIMYTYEEITPLVADATMHNPSNSEIVVKKPENGYSEFSYLNHGRIPLSKKSFVYGVPTEQWFLH